MAAAMAGVIRRRNGENENGNMAYQRRSVNANAMAAA
jgi:hypothetical protein